MGVGSTGTLDVGVVVVGCGERVALLVVVEGPEDLRFGGFVDTGCEFVDGALEEGVGGGG